MRYKAPLGNKMHYIHGREPARLYRIWKSMRQRCRDPKSSNYQRYGGRGIDICTEWDSFVSFRLWALSSGYDDSLSIDRLDNSKGYCPENCRWATATEQANNMRSNRILTCNGEQKTMAEWARTMGIKERTLHARLKAGWPEERAILEAVH